MTRTHHPMRRFAVLPVLGCLALATLSGCSSGTAKASASDKSASSSGASSADSHRPADTSPAADPPPAKQPVAPTRLSIPSVGISSSLMQLGLNQDGTVEVPPADKGMTAGWYTGSPAPGARGAAVLIGHNDTRFGRAVFHDLKKIGKGDDIAVRDARGRTAHFTVTGTESVSKKAFPTKKVYGNTDAHALRLVTCDGSFDAQGHPVNNLIVYATLR